MASNVIRALSSRTCLALRTRSMVEVRPISILSTPIKQSGVLNTDVSGRRHPDPTDVGKSA